MSMLVKDIVASMYSTDIVGVGILSIAAIIGILIIITIVTCARDCFIPLALLSFIPAITGLLCTLFAYTVSTQRIREQLAAFEFDADVAIQALRPIWRTFATIGAWASLVLLFIVVMGSFFCKRVEKNRATVITSSD